MTSTKTWFSKATPNLDVTSFFTRPIPAKSFLDSLGSSFGQAWLDGSKSIVDQQYNDGLPLWALAFWQKMVGIVEKQVLWRRSCRWLDSKAGKARGDNDLLDVIQSAHKKLSMTLGWDVPMHYQKGEITSSLLAILLSTAWLGDEHISMMMEELTARLALDPELSSKIIIAGLAFPVQINNNAKAKSYTKSNSCLLYCYQKQIEGGVGTIFFPLNVNEDHWIVGVINIPARAIGFGMCHRSSCSTH